MNRRPLYAVAGLLALVVVLGCCGGAAPTTQPGVGIVIPAGITRPVIQAKMRDASRLHLPLTLDAGTYRIDQPLVMPPGLRMRGNGSVYLVGTTAGSPIVVMSEGGRLEGLQFQGDAPTTRPATQPSDGVTGIAGEFVRSEVRDCDFWTSVTVCIDGHGLLSRITDCRFGLSGPWPSYMMHLRLRSDNSSTNAWRVDGCAFYHSVAADYGIDIGDGFQLTFEHNNVEQNRNRKAAVRVAGMFTVGILDNWFENNSGASQVELVQDRSNSIGNYTVDSLRNFINLNGEGNQQVYLTWGACHVRSADDSGTSFNGKRMGSEDAKVDLGHHWFVGYKDPAGDN
jgi:hypothetical protein